MKMALAIFSKTSFGSTSSPSEVTMATCGAAGTVLACSTASATSMPPSLVSPLALMRARSVASPARPGLMSA